MYYFINRALDCVLTANGWVDIDELSGGTYKILSVEKENGPTDVLAQLLAKYGKKSAKHTMLLRAEKLLTGRPAKVEVPNAELNVIKTGCDVVLQFLISHKKTTLDQYRSIFIDDSELNCSVQLELEALDDIPEDSFVRIRSQVSIGEAQFISDALANMQKIRELAENAENILATHQEILNDIEAQIMDELHYLEFNNLEDEELIKFTKNLQNLRIKRREVKDELFVASLLTDPSYSKFYKDLPQLESKISNLWHRSYVLKSPDKFDH